MGAWSKDSKSHVSSMSEGDFFGSEKSTVCEKACDLRIEHANASGEKKVLKASTTLQATLSAHLSHLSTLSPPAVR